MNDLARLWDMYQQSRYDDKDFANCWGDSKKDFEEWVELHFEKEDEAYTRWKLFTFFLLNPDEQGRLV